ncbi:sulfite exporter TauE/SafE family protein [Pseudomonas sp. UBA4194]|jgi:uncharacterized membrane protein YfcA|uniref:sulfite exporter TauE/SafE family protein n=1 Tax=Pseudomonas sp. UBA4194 TaxID=1947317 RepID=UPI0025F46D0A|nr:sulfite exporter TauE/SafE family protein [Pseudomonas sp. UBA4194]
MTGFIGFLLLGCAIGTLGGIFGIGGGLIALPILILVFDVDQQLAQGTVLMMVVPNVILALWRYHQRTRIELRHVLPLAISGAVFGWLGSTVAVGLDPGSMSVGFAIFMLVLAAYTFIQMYIPKAAGTGELKYGWPALATLGASSGILGGFFGLGGSVLATPILATVFGASQVVAQGLSLALAAPTTIATMSAYALHGHVDWRIGLPLAIGGMASVSWGVGVAYRMPERVLRTSFCLFLVLCAGLLLLKQA